MSDSIDSVIIVTTNDIPGYEVVQVLGEVFGLIVRARNVFSNFGASLRTLFGGEVGGYTTLLTDSRNQAIERLRLAAFERGGNAVLAMRFDCNEIADLMKVKSRLTGARSSCARAAALRKHRGDWRASIW
jgi:uncharacterized protein YbjQ (UPF0145 family)